MSMTRYEERLSSLAASVVSAGSFDPLLHPRTRDGKFITKGGWARGIFTMANGRSVKLNGQVVGFEKNPRAPQDPLVKVMTKYGELATPISNVIEAIAPKASLSAKLPWVKNQIKDIEQAVKKKTMTYDEAVAKVNVSADALSTDNVQERMKALDKIMGGVRGATISTAVHENRRGKSGDEWDAQRVAHHEEMWNEFIEKVRAAGIPQERKALALGGLPGAGKTTALGPGEPAGELGVIGWEPTAPVPAGATHVVLNPDIIKQLMIKRGMLPKGVSPKIKPMEQVSFIHAESNFITALFFDRIAAEGYNVVYDTTMANVPHIQKNLGPLRDEGYTFQGLFVDIPRQESRISAMRRYLENWQTPQGGRYVPSEAGNNDNRGVFRSMTGWFNDGWLVIDNTGVSSDPPNPRKEITARGVGEDPILAQRENAAKAWREWKPLMTAAEADAWAAGSASPGPWFHGTSREWQKTIHLGGFKPSKGGRFGAGVYLGDARRTAGYTSGSSASTSTQLETRIFVQNPMPHQEFLDITRNPPWPGFDQFQYKDAAWVQAEAKRRGYDAIVDNAPESAMGDEIIVFDREQVVVVDDVAVEAKRISWGMPDEFRWGKKQATQLGLLRTEPTGAEAFADEVDDSLADLLSVEAEDSREDWIFDVVWPEKYLSEALTDEQYQEALQANLKRWGFPDTITVLRKGPATGEVSNGSISRSWGRSAKAEGRELNSYQIPLIDIIGVGHPEEGEVFFRTARASQQQLLERTVGRQSATADTMRDRWGK